MTNKKNQKASDKKDQKTLKICLNSIQQ